METLGYNNNPLTYNGKFISAFDDGFSDLVPDCIIRRKTGYALRNALATKYSAGMETATPTDVHFANAFSSPYLYKKKVNFNTCTILPVSTGSSSPELGQAVYYSYPSASTDYIYFHLNSSGEYDLTNLGSINGSLTWAGSPGESEVIRLKFLGAATGPSMNLSDYTAVRNVYMPNLTGSQSNPGIQAIFNRAGSVADCGPDHNVLITAGDGGGSMYVPKDYPVKVLENFIVPTGWGGSDKANGWSAISSMKNCQFGSAVDLGPALREIEDVTGTYRNDYSQPIRNCKINGGISGNFTNSTFSACTIGFEKPTSIAIIKNGFASGYGTKIPDGTYTWRELSGFSLMEPVIRDCSIHPDTLITISGNTP